MQRPQFCNHSGKRVLACSCPIVGARTRKRREAHPHKFWRIAKAKERSMKTQAGLWIDHREAFAVLIGDGAEKTERIESGMEKHVRFSGRSAADEGSADDQRDRQFASHLNRYYDEVISYIRNAESILLFGPGEAKRELEKRLTNAGLGGRIVGIETVDKMTDRQIAAKVRQHFLK
jgi:hypothetical protein